MHTLFDIHVTSNKVIDYDSTIKNLNKKLIIIQNDIENLIYALTEYLEKAENDENCLEEIQKRLFYLQNLERTFSLELPQLILKRYQYIQALLELLLQIGTHTYHQR